MNATSSESDWPAPPKDLVPGDNEVHVWRASLQCEAGETQEFLDYLSEDERARAGRFCIEEARGHFIVGRALLRAILGRYLGVEPSRLRFSYGSHGKPALAPEWAAASLCFNMSDSHGLALYAVARRRELGVDLERIRPGVACERIARRHFAEAEVKSLLALPESARREAFFACWSRKEAYTKAIGQGLSFPLRDIVVSLSPGEPAAILNVRGEPEAARRWSLRALKPDPCYAAALIAEGHDWRVRRWQWAANSTG